MIAAITIISLLIPLYVAIAKDVDVVVETPTEESYDLMIAVVEEEVEKSVFDNNTLFQICRCESDIFGRGEPTQYELDGTTILTGRIDSADTGACQINKRYHLKDSIALGYDIDTLQGNWDYAKHLLNTQGTRPWNASKGCWGNRI